MKAFVNAVFLNDISMPDLSQKAEMQLNDISDNVSHLNIILNTVEKEDQVWFLISEVSCVSFPFFPPKYCFVWLGEPELWVMSWWKDFKT